MELFEGYFVTAILLPENCPGCGRSLAAGNRTSFCPDCNAANVKDQGIRKVSFLCKVSRKQAIEVVRQWWNDNRLIAGSIESEVRIVDCHLQYVPFWKITVAARAHVEGYRYESDDSCTRKIPMDHHFDNYLTWTGIAGDSADTGIEFLRNLSGEKVPLDKCPGPFGPVTVSKIAAEAKSRKAMEQHILEAADIPVVTSMPMSLELWEAVLLYYPIWTVRYWYSGRTYSVTVDGVTVRLMAGKAPGDTGQRYRALASGLLVSLILVVVHVWAIYAGHILSYHSGQAFGCVALSAVVILLIIDAVTFLFIAENFGHFRYGTVIAGGDEKNGYRPAEASESTGKHSAFICMLAGLALIAGSAYLILKSGNSLYSDLAMITGLIVYLVSCWYSYENKLTIKGQVQEGLTP